MIAEKRTALENKNIDSAAVESAANAEIAEPGDYPPGAQLCKKCNVTAMVLMDGCMTCLNCGDSKCG